jgi:hypothetical protein
VSHGKQARKKLEFFWSKNEREFLLSKQQYFCLPELETNVRFGANFAFQIGGEEKGLLLSIPEALLSSSLFEDWAEKVTT